VGTPAMVATFGLAQEDTEKTIVFTFLVKIPAVIATFGLTRKDIEIFFLLQFRRKTINNISEIPAISRVQA
jgi:hypothetical protein